MGAAGAGVCTRAVCEALQQGDRLPPAEFDAMAAKVAAITGLSVEYVKESKLRISATRFRKELLRDDDRTLGRYDARFMGWDPDAAGENPGYDPSDTGISGVVRRGVPRLHSARTEVHESGDRTTLRGPG